MACRVVSNEGGLITVQISGKLKWTEFAGAQKSAIQAMRPGGKVRLLVLTEDFEGWDDRGDWGDVSFQMRYDEQIEKIAVVGDRRWQEMIEVFVGKGIRPVDIRYFAPSQEALARTWIGQTTIG